MSLSESIFGASSVGGGGVSSSDVFSSSKVLPPKPQHLPVVTLSKNVKQQQQEEQKKVVKGGKKRMRLMKQEEQEKHQGAEASKEEEATKEETEMETQDQSIFVGNLPITITRKEIAAIFSEVGQIKSCRIRSVPVQGVKLPTHSKGNQALMRKVCANTQKLDNEAPKSTVNAYVVFESEESVKAALEFNGKPVPGHEEMTMRVDTSSPTHDASRSIFVGNLPYSAAEDKLRDHFSRIGTVQGVRIVRDKQTMKCKGFGYVLFEAKDMVTDALKLDGSSFMTREIRVQVCGKKYKGKQGKGGDKSGKGFEGRRATEPSGATRRLLGKTVSSKQLIGEKVKNSSRKRSRSDRTNTSSKGIDGKSRRAATESKVKKRMKQLQKRTSKGMGKNKSTK